MSCEKAVSRFFGMTFCRKLAAHIVADDFGCARFEQFAVITQFAFPDVTVLSNPGSKLA